MTSLWVWSIKSFTTSEFCAKDARHRDVLEHLAIFQTKPAIVLGTSAGMVFNVV